MKVYKYGANVDTDVIIPARHLNDPSLPPSTTPFPTLEAPKADKPQTDDSLPELGNRLDKLFSDTLSNLNNCEKTAQNTIFHLVKSIS